MLFYIDQTGEAYVYDVTRLMTDLYVVKGLR